MPSLGDLDKGLQQTAYLNASLKALLAQKALPTRKQVMDMASDLLQRGVLSPQRLATELATLPENPDEIMKWVQGHYATTSGQIAQLMGMMHGAADPSHPLNGVAQTIAAASPQPPMEPPAAPSLPASGLMGTAQGAGNGPVTQ
jgi:hypothetical protein